jgi:hypothetical protein
VRAWGAGLVADIVTDPLPYSTSRPTQALAPIGMTVQKTGPLKGFTGRAMLAGFHVVEPALLKAGSTASDITRLVDQGRKIATVMAAATGSFTDSIGSSDEPSDGPPLPTSVDHRLRASCETTEVPSALDDEIPPYPYWLVLGRPRRSGEATFPPSSSRFVALHNRESGFARLDHRHDAHADGWGPVSTRGPLDHPIRRRVPNERAMLAIHFPETRRQRILPEGRT